MSLICHLVRPSDWETALQRRVYRPASLKAEGFIHFSSPTQLIPSALRHFPLDQELVVLYVSERKTEKKLKWEAASDGELFPHLYGALYPEDIEFTRFLIRNPDGNWELVY